MNSVLVALDAMAPDTATVCTDRCSPLSSYQAKAVLPLRPRGQGPTEAQKRYARARNLGNPPQVDDDGGKLYIGWTPGQLTGKGNHEAFYNCARQHGSMAGPGIWYWQSRNLNRWADQADIETITKKWNGSIRGFADRIDRFVRVSLVVLGYVPRTPLSSSREAPVPMLMAILAP
ncbi:hypothetical protein [Rhizobium sp. S163]|uniref:hypothetical protein n=1 Tax=Rhizobium sp. S163 TaxID=3055039 RepID=UPI0025A9CE33|nr:hypothetical protein [Rhizobium sp. S163]MDM9645596.1 hypothetical protein [Rhizobium sp. S163]